MIPKFLLIISMQPWSMMLTDQGAYHLLIIMTGSSRICQD